MGNILTGAELEARAIEGYRSLTPEGQREVREFAYAVMHDPAKADRMARKLKAQVEGMKGGAAA